MSATPNLPQDPTPSTHWEWCGRGCRSLAEARVHEASLVRQLPTIEVLPPRVLCADADCPDLAQALWLAVQR